MTRFSGDLEMKQREVGRRSYGAMMALLMLIQVLNMGVFAGGVSGAEKRYRPKPNQMEKATRWYRFGRVEFLDLD